MTAVLPVASSQQAMMSRRFNAAALTSALLLGVTVILFLSAFRQSSHEPLVSLSPRFHIAVTDGFRHEPDARIAFFNEPVGPYRGSIIALDDGADIRTSAFGDKWGVYYRGWHGHFSANDVALGQGWFGKVSVLRSNKRLVPGAFARENGSRHETPDL